MSITIHCPHCGPRHLEEFLYGEILTPPASITSEEALELDRSFMHSNIEGPTRERWFHHQGCRRWIDVVRDTRTEQFVLPL